MKRLLLVLLIAGCAADVRSNPERLTREWAQLRIDGDPAPLYRLLSTLDQVELPVAGFPANLPAHAQFWPIGMPRTRLDSVRVVSAGNRGPYAIAYMTAPDFDRSNPGGLAQLAADGVDREAVERVAATLPRVTRSDSVALVREDGQWRITLQPGQRARAQALWRSVSDAVEIRSRAQAASRFLAVADSVVGYDPASRAEALGHARAWAMRDSIEFDLRIEGPSFQAMITGEVRNRSSTMIHAVHFTALTSNGDQVPLSLRMIPARGTNRVMKLGKAGGRVTGVSITSLVFDQ